jgi:hypothetical protein
VKLIRAAVVAGSARLRCARVPTKGPSRLNADGSSAEDDVRTTPVSDTPSRGQTPERANAYREGGRYGWGTLPGAGPSATAPEGGFPIYLRTRPAREEAT